MDSVNVKSIEEGWIDWAEMDHRDLQMHNHWKAKPKQMGDYPMSLSNSYGSVSSIGNLSIGPNIWCCMSFCRQPKSDKPDQPSSIHSTFHRLYYYMVFSFSGYIVAEHFIGSCWHVVTLLLCIRKW